MNAANSLLIKADLTSDRFAQQWAVFHDSQVCQFLGAFLDRRIAASLTALEHCSEQELLRFQGCIAELRALKNLIERPNVHDEATNVANSIK